MKKPTNPFRPLSPARLSTETRTPAEVLDQGVEDDPATVALLRRLLESAALDPSEVLRAAGWHPARIPGSLTAGSGISCTPGEPAPALSQAGPDGGTFTDGLPAHWSATVRRNRWGTWTATGTYSGPEIGQPRQIVSGWCWTRSQAITQVGYWIEDADALDRTWWLSPAELQAAEQQAHEQDRASREEKAELTELLARAAIENHAPTDTTAKPSTDEQDQ